MCVLVFFFFNGCWFVSCVSCYFFSLAYIKGVPWKVMTLDVG